MDTGVCPPPRLKAPPVLQTRPRTGLRRSSHLTGIPVRDPSCQNVNNFFYTCEQFLQSESNEIDDEARALHAQRQHQRRRRRSHSIPSTPHATASSSFGFRRPASRSAGSTRRSASSARAFRAPSRQGAELYLREWQEHDSAWDHFQHEVSSPLTEDKVPWPPCAGDVLEFYERLLAPGQPRQAYHLACRRWHPDKFLQHYGSLVLPEHMPSIVSRLNTIFHSLTVQWERAQLAGC